MLNHDEEVGCEFAYVEEWDCFVVEWQGTGSPPNVGEQLFLNYGKKCSGELLLMYGFVPSHPNDYDSWLLEGAYCQVRLSASGERWT